MRNWINLIESITAQTPMYHGTAAEPFTEFQSWRPAFFTSHRPYAEVYSTKGSGKPRIITVHLNITNMFDGSTPDQIAFYNSFIDWMATKQHHVPPLTLGEHVPFIWADDFFVFLRREWRAGTSTYDGITVDEGSFGSAVGGHGDTIVPLFTSQITIL